MVRRHCVFMARPQATSLHVCCLLSVFTTCPFNAWKDVCADTRGVLTASFKNLLSLDNTRPYCTRHVGQLGTHTHTHTTQLPIFVMRGGGGGG